MRIYSSTGILVALGLLLAGIAVAELTTIDRQVTAMAVQSDDNARVLQIQQLLDDTGRATLGYWLSGDAAFLKQAGDADASAEVLLREAATAARQEEDRRAFAAAIAGIAEFRRTRNVLVIMGDEVRDMKRDLADGGDAIVQQSARLGSAAAASGKPDFNAGFRVATALFCAAPLAVLGSVAEGLDPNGFSKVLCVKAVMDGMATMAFSKTFGRGVMLSAIPVLAWQGAIIRCAELLRPALEHQPQPLIDSVNATVGLLVFCVALIILQLKKVAVADYLPSLALAPILTRWLW